MAASREVAVRRIVARLAVSGLCLGLIGTTSSSTSLVAFAQEGGKPSGHAGDSPHRAEVRALIEQLVGGDLKQREGARARLIQLGDDAVPLLEEAAKRGDPERVDAANEVLSLLRWRLPKNLEALVGQPLEDYPSLKLEQRAFGLARIREHLQEARSLAPFLANVARFDPDAKLRGQGLELYLALTPRGDPPHDLLVLEALEAEPPRKELHGPKASLLARLGRGEEAVKEARKALAGEHSNAQTSLLLADMLVASGNATEAIALLDDLATKAPADVDVASRLGEAYLLAGQAKKGEEILARVLKTRIDSPSTEKAVLLRVARAWIRAGRADDAQEVLRVAVQKQPYDQDVNVALAEVDLALGRVGPALARLLSEARYTQRDSEELRTIKKVLVRLFETSGESEVAQDDDLYEDARRGRPLAKARLNAGRFLLARGLTEEAARLFREAAALDPTGIEARIRQGDALRRLGRDDEARKVYEAARALAPKDENVGERLRSLALGSAADGSRAVVTERAGDIVSWDRRLLPDELKGEPEAVVETAPPPIVAAGKVLFVPAGSLTLVALEVKEGLPAFRTRLEPPPPPEGVEADLVGLEIAGLVSVPASAVAALAPARARDGTPLAGLLVNEWVRTASRSFRKARFETALLYLVDPVDGKVLDRTALLDEPVSSGAAPVARGSRALVITQPDESRANLVLVDLVARRARWKQGLEGGPVGRPLFAGDLLVAASSQGVFGFAADGSLKVSFVGAPQTRVAAESGALWFAEGGVLKRLPLDGSPVRDVANAPSGEAFSGEPAVVGTSVLCGTRGGGVRSYDPATGRVVATMPLDRLDRAAARSLVTLGARAFAVNGAQDAFADELATLLALDPADLAIVWRRPLDRGAAVGTGEGMIVASSGSLRSASGIRVTAARPGAPTVDARPRFLAEMRSAAEDAMAGGELEVAAVIARRFVVLKGGLELASADDLVFLARALALSNRPDDAEAIIEIARGRDPSPAAAARFEKLHTELGLDRAPDPSPSPAAPPAPQAPPAPATPGAPGDKPGPPDASPAPPADKPDAGSPKPAETQPPAPRPEATPPTGG